VAEIMTYGVKILI